MQNLLSDPTQKVTISKNLSPLIPRSHGPTSQTDHPRRRPTAHHQNMVVISDICDERKPNLQYYRIKLVKSFLSSQAPAGSGRAYMRVEVQEHDVGVCPVMSGHIHIEVMSKCSGVRIVSLRRS